MASPIKSEKPHFFNPESKTHKQLHYESRPEQEVANAARIAIGQTGLLDLKSKVERFEVDPPLQPKKALPLSNINELKEIKES